MLNVQCQTVRLLQWKIPRRLTLTRYNSLYDFEYCALAVACSRARQQCTNSVNGLTGPTNHTAHVSAPKLQFKDNCSAARNFGEHHVIGELDQLPNDELEKFSHPSETNHKWTRINTNFSSVMLRPQIRSTPGMSRG
jgi:hypothetical protein